MKNKFAGFLIRVSISLAFIGGISYLMRDKLGDAAVTLRHGVSWQWFYAGIGIYFLAQFFLSLRFYYLLKVQNVPVRFWDVWQLNFTGLFFNLFLPSAVGGDVAKAYYIAQRSGSTVKATTCVVQDRLVGFVAMLALAVTAVLFSSGMVPAQGVIPLLVAGIFFTGLMIFFFAHKPFARIFRGLLNLVPFPKVRKLLADLYHAIHGYRHHKKILLAGLGLSWISQSIFILLHYLMALALGVSSPLEYYFLVVPISCFISMAPSLGGVGVREAGILFFLNRIMPAEKALALSLLVSAIIYGFSLAGGLVFAVRGGLKKDGVLEKNEGACTS